MYNIVHVCVSVCMCACMDELCMNELCMNMHVFLKNMFLCMQAMLDQLEKIPLHTHARTRAHMPASQELTADALFRLSSTCQTHLFAIYLTSWHDRGKRNGRLLKMMTTALDNASFILHPSTTSLFNPFSNRHQAIIRS